jgi:GT2 family glycosyltransferase
MPELSLVIVTCNSEKYIIPCLDSIFNQEYRDFEVFVVDNGSKDATLSLVEKNYPQVTLLRNKENSGACKARNEAIGVSCAEWILTLDCDIVLKKGFLKKILGFAEGVAPSVGIIAPKILYPDQKTIYSCGIALSKFRRFFDISNGKPLAARAEKTEYVFGACAAAALYKRQMLEDIKENTGYFDERFFFLVEDVDLAWRAGRKGWKAQYFPAAVCYHSGNSSGSDKKIRQYLCFRNRYYSIAKNEGVKKYLKSIFPPLLYDFPRILYLIMTNPYFRGKRLHKIPI